MVLDTSVSEQATLWTMKKVALILLGVFLLLATIGFFSIRAVINRASQTAEVESVVSETGPIVVSVIETGKLQSARNVEVKSRVSGRVARLLVDEGDYVEAGELIAVVDPEETEFRVQQDRAQIRGAQSGLQASAIDIEQRRVTARSQLERARARVEQLRIEIEVQPTLESTSRAVAESQLASAREDLRLLTTVTQPNERIGLEKALEDARNRAVNASVELERRKNLFEQGYISQRVLEEAELNLRLAESTQAETQARLDRLSNQHSLQVRNAEQRIAQAQAEVARANASRTPDTLQQQLRQAQADVRDAEVALRDVDRLGAQRGQQLASLQQLQSVLNDSLRQLAETEIRAPISGIVTRRLVQEGELVASLSSFSAGTPVVEIENRSAMQVLLHVNEIDVAKLSEGTNVAVVVDALPNQEFDGTITKIAPATVAGQAQQGAQAMTGVVRYEVEVTMRDTTDRMKSGMTAKCTIKVVDLDSVLRIPLDYLGEDEQGAFVILKEESAKDEPERIKTRVTAGERSGTHVQIIEGLNEGQELIMPAFSGPQRKGFFDPPSEN